MNDELRKIVKTAIVGPGPTPEEASVIGGALFTYGWRASAFAFALWGLGLFGRFGLGDGFAYAQSTRTAQTNIENRLSAIERRQLEQDINTAHKEWCASLQSGSVSSREYFRGQVSKMQEEYATKYRAQLTLPTCEQLGITQ